MTNIFSNNRGHGGITVLIAVSCMAPLNEVNFPFFKKHFDTLFKYYVNYYTRVYKSITKNMSQYHNLYILNNFMRPV